MANNKSSGWHPKPEHAMLYTVPAGLITFITAGLLAQNAMIGAVAGSIIAVAVFVIIDVRSKQEVTQQEVLAAQIKDMQDVRLQYVLPLRRDLQNLNRPLHNPTTALLAQTADTIDPLIGDVAEKSAPINPDIIVQMERFYRNLNESAAEYLDLLTHPDKASAAARQGMHTFESMMPALLEKAKRFRQGLNHNDATAFITTVEFLKLHQEE